METINTIEEYNKILNTTLSHNFEEQIEIINNGNYTYYQKEYIIIFGIQHMLYYNYKLEKVL